MNYMSNHSTITLDELHYFRVWSLFDTDVVLDFVLVGQIQIFYNPSLATQIRAVQYYTLWYINLVILDKLLFWMLHQTTHSTLFFFFFLLLKAALRD